MGAGLKCCLLSCAVECAAYMAWVFVALALLLPFSSSVRIRLHGIVRFVQFFLLPPLLPRCFCACHVDLSVRFFGSVISFLLLYGVACDQIRKRSAVVGRMLKYTHINVLLAARCGPPIERENACPNRERAGESIRVCYGTHAILYNNIDIGCLFRFYVYTYMRHFHTHRRPLTHC